MVDVSIETRAQTDARLCAVMRQARVRIYERPYCFREFAAADFPAAVDAKALALVRDADRWSQLVPYDGSDEEAFGIFSFHFPPNLDNSGFVGWLATHLKEAFGSGVLVVCGMNRDDGGVFDYWGCPTSIAPSVFDEIRKMNLGS
jgi:hypothetical protein